MNLKICSIYDVKAGVYLQPFYARAKGEAIRTFSDLANDNSSPVGLHPEDYVCYLIGEFDQMNGQILPAPEPEPVGKAIEFITQDQ